MAAPKAANSAGDRGTLGNPSSGTANCPARNWRTTPAAGPTVALERDPRARASGTRPRARGQVAKHPPPTRQTSWPLPAPRGRLSYEVILSGISRSPLLRMWPFVIQVFERRADIRHLDQMPKMPGHEHTEAKSPSHRARCAKRRSQTWPDRPPSRNLSCRPVRRACPRAPATGGNMA